MVVPLTKRLPFPKGGAHEGRRQWRKQAVVSPVGTELRRAQCAKQAKRKSNEQRRLASGSVARRLLRIVGTEEHRKRALRAAEARRAEVASTRSEAQCTATEHRAAVRRERCEDKRSGRFVGKPEVCQRSEGCERTAKVLSQPSEY